MRYHYLTNDDNIINSPEEFQDYLKDTIPETLSFHTKYFDYDFNNGFRIKFNTREQFFIVIKNKNNNYIYFSGIITPEDNVIYSFIKKYYIEYVVTIHKVKNNLPDSFPIETIEFNVENKDILFILGIDDGRCGLGDGIAWLQSILFFMNKHVNTKIYLCSGYSELNEVIKTFVSNIIIINSRDIKKYNFYATYLHGCFYKDKFKNYNPVDYHLQNLIEMGYKVIGEPTYNNVYPIIQFKYNLIKPKKHYICMAVHASSVSKEWIPGIKNIETLIEILKNYNYDVYIIDKDRNNTHNNLIQTNIPKNGIDCTGNMSLLDRIKLLSCADFFIGCSSGLSWLAWSVGIPVILISGFTNPKTEFYTPYRIINYNKCNSCWNDFTNKNPLENPCPKKYPFQSDWLECSTSITIDMVLEKIFSIPDFLEYIDDE